MFFFFFFKISTITSQGWIFPPFFLSRTFVFQGHVIKERSVQRHIWILFWMLDYRILSLIQSLGTKFQHRKKGRNLAIMQKPIWLIFDDAWTQKLKYFNHGPPQCSDWCSPSKSVWEGTSSISEAKDSDSTEITSKVRAQNLGNITAVNSLGTMVHGAPCVFATRSPSQHWNWSPNLQPWSWKLTPYWVAWCQAGFCHYVRAVEIYFTCPWFIYDAPDTKPWNCQTCRWAHAIFWSLSQFSGHKMDQVRIWWQNSC